MKRPSRSKKANAVRDESPTPFGVILTRLLQAVPGALAAVIVDAEGEAVDYVGGLPALETKLAGAHLRVVLDTVREGSALPATSSYQLSIRAAGQSFLVKSLPDGYALALVLARRAFRVSPRALAVAERELSAEAGWSRERSPRSWYPVAIEPVATNSRKPHQLQCGAEWEPVEVLGTLVGLEHEHGYRCRLVSGAEFMLVREPKGRWYADELVEPRPGSKNSSEPAHKGRSR